MAGLAAAAVLLAGLAVPAETAPADPDHSGRTIVMSQAPQGSRPPPPRIQPIVHDGIRYEEDMESGRHGGTGRGGYLVARNAATGERLWSIAVYHVPAAAPDAPGAASRYFRTMSLVAGGSAIAIEDEAGGRYVVDLASRNVTAETSPARRPAEAPPSKPKPKF